MCDVAPAAHVAITPAPLPQPQRQHRAASDAGTASGDVAMADAPAQQLRQPRHSTPCDSVMSDAPLPRLPPLRLPPP